MSASIKTIAKNWMPSLVGFIYRAGLNEVSKRRYRDRPKRFLEIGPGPKRIEGFESLNVVWWPNVDYVADASTKLPFPDNTFDLVYGSHVLEHIPWYKTESVLAEWRRILKPGGRLEIWVPNGLEICRAFVMAEEQKPNDIEKDGWYRFNEERDPAKWAAGRIFSYGDGRGTPGHHNWHLALFSERYLIEVFERVGFADCGRLSAEEVRGYDHGWINMGIGGTKSNAVS
ncbi:class I SAM-dependent methyltransferase [Mesorhizobium sp. M1006]|uniref:class I SAM-dependent methyltransferase n=1 Tax=Mesorhizobium sp. M1006 TaxID=2957048 RepID=UPI0033352CF1